ncbi:carbon-nitrogen hydrolase family protein [Dyadobacter sp. CY261]|uniref:carbon-nitrogen hydrolase family protein n=1 Tax=Dyadobacter sp. CY261 TaxID=2907203 RepID=UPI001F3A5E14|nr:carbon-nitrogen hydrolase family protein [Dyadobacter sp. CY261]MCF0071389.1 carbon-nitrogen hydrolase family protein [Dyadobacter sp. CY261]
MMQQVTIASAQYPITEHADFLSWQQHTENWVTDAANRDAELLLFPEYGAMELVSIFETEIRNDIRRQIHGLNALKDDFCATFEALSRKCGVIIVAPSIPVIERGRNLNRTFVFSPNGLAGYQDKFFMTRFENEHWGVESAPKQLTVFEAAWGQFGIQICYDVEFPLGAQKMCEAGAKLILAPSCTETIRGAARVHIGARARALENQVYTVVSQTVGEALWSPAVDINYGYAAFYTTPDKDMPEEGIIASMPVQQEGWLVQKLDFSLVDEARNDGHVFNFKDQARVEMRMAGEEISVIHRTT